MNLIERLDLMSREADCDRSTHMGQSKRTHEAALDREAIETVRAMREACIAAKSLLERMSMESSDEFSALTHVIAKAARVDS